MTVFTSAIDDRVTVAVPSGFTTSYRRMLQINGVQVPYPLTRAALSPASCARPARAANGSPWHD